MPTLIMDSIHRLRQETGLDWHLDGSVLSITHPGEPHRIQLLERRGFRAAHVERMKESVTAPAWAVVTEHVGRALARELRESGVQFLETWRSQFRRRRACWS